MNILILQPNILGTIMSSYACCALEEYYNASMLRGVQVPWAREKWCIAEHKGWRGGEGGVK